MWVDSLRVAAARYALGLARAEELVAAADEALNHGTYSEALGELYDARDLRMADAGPLFERALTESGLSVPSKDDAIWITLRCRLRPIAGGSVPPREGLHNVLMELCLPDSYDLGDLLAAFYAYRRLRAGAAGGVSHPGEEVTAIDRDIVRLAREWLAAHPDPAASP